MKKSDRVVRVIVGVVLLGIGHFTKNFWFLLGLIPLGTGLLGYCPLYKICGKKNNTCS